MSADIKVLDPHQKKTHANITAPEIANFFSLHPIPYRAEKPPPILRPNLLRMVGAADRTSGGPVARTTSGSSPMQASKVTGIVQVNDNEDRTYGFISGGNEKKKFVQI